MNRETLQELEDKVLVLRGKLAAQRALVEHHKRRAEELKGKQKGMRLEALQEALCAACGCDEQYNGGHSGAECEAYHHGIRTVVNVLTALIADPDDTQVAACRRSGRHALAEEKQTEGENYGTAFGREEEDPE